MSDTVFIRKARFPCRIGVSTAERSTPQNVLIDLDLTVDLSEPGRSDDVTTTLDYREVWHLVRRCTEEREFRLVEALAARIGREVLDRFVQVERVAVEVVKPAALSKKGVEAVGVRLTFDRHRSP